MKITIIGTGYVGLVTGACLAQAGHEVWCIDKNENKIGRLADGRIPIYEPGLEALVKRGISGKKLFFATDLGREPWETDIYFLTVDTPPGPDQKPNLDNLFAACQTLCRHLSPTALIVTKSTVPPGTTLKIKDWLEKSSGLKIRVANNPEFLREGSAVSDFQNPDRVVAGVEKDEDAEPLRALYRPFLQDPDRFLVMDIPSAELAKYAANAMLACRISFMNELSHLSKKVGADIGKIRQAVGLDHRIGNRFLTPGLGYGGSCLPKDVTALIALGRETETPLPLLHAVDETNKKQREIFLAKILGFFESRSGIAGKKIAFWGISFKPETDDIREAPAISLIETLIGLGVRIRAFDPAALETGRAVLPPSVEWSTDPWGCLEGCDGLVICTEWSVFRAPDFSEMKRRMRQPVIFDGRNLYDPAPMRQLGFEYWSLNQ